MEEIGDNKEDFGIYDNKLFFIKYLLSQNGKGNYYPNSSEEIETRSALLFSKRLFLLLK